MIIFFRTKQAYSYAHGFVFSMIHTRAGKSINAVQPQEHKRFYVYLRFQKLIKMFNIGSGLKQFQTTTNGTKQALYFL